MKQRTGRQISAAVLAFAWAAAFCLAQVDRGALRGVVRDSSGAVVPGAKIRIVNIETGQSITVASQGDGGYVAPQLRPGDYKAFVSHDGFKTLEAGPVKVDVSTTATLDFVMELGSVSETLTVTGESSLIEASSARVGTTIAVKQMLEMPLADRNVFTLVNIVPSSFYVRDREAISVGGGRVQENTALLDGVYDSRGGLGTQGIEVRPSVESMQEFKVEANNMTAEFGRSTGGVVNAVTKSGTNEFRGNFYEFLRNDALDATGWNADAKPPLRRNNFGATIGGPLRRNRSFFFYNLEALRESNPSSVTRNVGLPEWRRGDFSKATRDAGGRAEVVRIYDPDTGTGVFTAPRNTQPFPNNIIPSSRLDSVAVKALGFLPGPNREPDNPFNYSGNWQQNVALTQTTDLHTVRLDHQFREGTTAFFRYIFSSPNRQKGAASADFGPADPNQFTLSSPNHHLAVSATHLFSPSFFLNVTAGVVRSLTNRRSAACCDQNFGGLFGLRNVPGGESFPRFDVQGGLVPITAIGSSDIALRNAAFTNTDIKGDLTKVRGRHTFKFGANHVRYNGNDLARRSPSGRYYFTERFTTGYDAAGTAVRNTGIRMADFLLGRLDRVQAQVAPTFGRRIQHYAGYFQDDWRVSGSLTVNLGLRYETETPQYEVNNRFNGFNPWEPNPLAGTGDIPAGARGVMLFPGRNGQGKYLTRWDKNNFAPRFGFAWRPFGRNDTVVRGGYGIYFGNPYSRQTIQRMRIGFEPNYDVRHPIPFTLKDGLPPGVADPIPESELTGSFGNRGTRFARSDVEYLAPDRTTPYNHNINLTIQRQVDGVLFEVGYVGNLARHATFQTINWNMIPEALLPQTNIPERLRRPWTIFAGNQPLITENSPTIGIANYHALILKSERRFRRGLGFVAAYTFSKLIDNVPSLAGDDGTFGDNDDLQNVYNLRGERSLSTNHFPHRLVLSPIVDLPLGKGRRWLNQGRVINGLFGGWQVSGIITLQSGSPFGVTVLNGGRDILGDVSQTLRADLVSEELASPRQGASAAGVRGLEWLNPAAFAAPARFRYGSAARTLPGVLGPGLVNIDSMLSKNFALFERYRLQFRWEMFNASNTPYFDLPQQSLGAGGFGIITAASNRRIMQMGLKLYW